MMRHLRLGTSHLMFLVTSLSLCTTSAEDVDNYWQAMIISVISDSSPTHGKLIVEVANKGYMLGSFRVQIFDCPPFVPVPGEVPGNRTATQQQEQHLNSKPKKIHPQRIHEFQFSVKYGSHGRPLLTKPTWCTVAVLDTHRDMIALRQILLTPNDTCICYLNCVCTCIKDSLTCTKRLSRADSIAAGIHDQEILNEFDSIFQDLLQSATDQPFMFTVLLLLFLLFLGLCKGLVGLCCCGGSCGCECECCEQNWIGKLGLGYFYNQPRHLVKYYEKQYSNIAVVHMHGYPVDPITRKPTVQRLSRGELLAYNIILFVIWPFICCHYLTLCCFGVCTGDASDDEAEEKRRRRRRQQQVRKSYADLVRRAPRSRHSSDELIEMVPSFKKQNPETIIADRDQYQDSEDGKEQLESEHPTVINLVKDDDDEDEVVHYSRPASRQPSSEHKQYGLSFFMNDDGLGSGSGNFPTRNDSNVSITNVRGADDRSTERMYRRTSAGQQEYADRLLSRAVRDRQQLETSSETNTATGATVSNKSSRNFPILSNYGSWHREPSQWSVRRSSVEKLDNPR